MKKLSAKLILISSLTFVLLASCKKEDAPATTTGDPQALLQNKNWKLTSGTISPAWGGMTDWFSNWDACERDDLFRFNSGGTYILDEGATTCNPGDPQSRNGNWSYTAGTKILHFALTPPSDSYDLTIVQISENSFTGQTTDVIGGVTYTETWVFTKQ